EAARNEIQGGGMISVALERDKVFPALAIAMMKIGEQIFLLFVVFAETPERIKRGLEGAYLPFVVQTLRPAIEEETTEYLGVAQLRDDKG
ncbi:MAG: hypothetical protein GDA48_18535, partial [Hormoscilla sp. GM102CHS1]|nr:hypothetical protein [Hormoscilla sp. GM102CHS1]